MESFTIKNTQIVFHRLSSLGRTLDILWNSRFRRNVLFGKKKKNPDWSDVLWTMPFWDSSVVNCTDQDTTSCFPYGAFIFLHSQSIPIEFSDRMDHFGILQKIIFLNQWAFLNYKYLLFRKLVIHIAREEF